LNVVEKGQNAKYVMLRRKGSDRLLHITGVHFETCITEWDLHYSVRPAVRAAAHAGSRSS
jgi:hypothetical protein